MPRAQQRQQTLHALLTILLRIAAQQPVLFVMEDLHWVDPTTLELLTLLIDQGPTPRILALCTFRPDFSPPWTGRAHLTQVTLPRLPRRQAAEMTGQVAHGKMLPVEVMEQVVTKTAGVPLFVEELTKVVLESGLLQERDSQAYALRLLGDIAARREPPQVEAAAAHYEQALALAEELGMRPLQAHCYLGLGTLYAATGPREPARAALATAIALYRAMEMAFWLPQAEAALAQAG